MKEKSYFEAMFGTIPSSDAGNTFLLNLADRYKQSKNDFIKEAYIKPMRLGSLKLSYHGSEQHIFGLSNLLF